MKLWKCENVKISKSNIQLGIGCWVLAVFTFAHFGLAHAETVKTASQPWVTNRVEMASAALRGEIAAKADATGVSTNFTAATGTTNDIWVSDIDGTVLRCVDASRWIGTGANSYGFVRDIDLTPPSILYELRQWVDSSFTLSLLDPETGEELAVPAVIDGQQDAVWLDWDTVATNDTLVGRFDNSDYGIHIGPHHLRRHGGVQVSATRVVYTDDLDYSTNNVALAKTIGDVIPGNVYWVTTDGGRTLKAYPRVNGSTNTINGATFQRGNVWLEYDNGRISAFTDEEVP